MNHTIEVEKDNIYNIQYRQQKLEPLQAGEVRLHIVKYGWTTNNITYAVTGKKLQYWDFYPTGTDYGIIPVWGYGRVVESKLDDVKTGELYYGYFPMANYCTLSPHKIQKDGFSDGAAHRLQLAPVYNYYSKTATDPVYNASTEDYLPIIKPLFATSFLIYQFLNQKDFLNADQIIVTSASSKTSLALAYMLKRHQSTHQKKIVALTSDRNIDFVKSTSYYDIVLTYNQYKEIDSARSVVVDMSGNFILLRDLNTYFNDNLLKIILVGLTDWKSGGHFSSLQNSEFFFAPTHMKTFYASQGVQQANAMLNEALKDFIVDAKRSIELDFITDPAALESIYLKMLDGNVNPSKGYIVTQPMS